MHKGIMTYCIKYGFVIWSNYNYNRGDKTLRVACILVVDQTYNLFHSSPVLWLVMVECEVQMPPGHRSIGIGSSDSPIAQGESYWLLWHLRICHYIIYLLCSKYGQLFRLLLLLIVFYYSKAPMKPLYLPRNFDNIKSSNKSSNKYY